MASDKPCLPETYKVGDHFLLRPQGATWPLSALLPYVSLSRQSLFCAGCHTHNAWRWHKKYIHIFNIWNVTLMHTCIILVWGLRFPPKICTIFEKKQLLYMNQLRSRIMASLIQGTRYLTIPRGLVRDVPKGLVRLTWKQIYIICISVFMFWTDL